MAAPSALSREASFGTSARSTCAPSRLTGRRARADRRSAGRYGPATRDVGAPGGADTRADARREPGRADGGGQEHAEPAISDDSDEVSHDRAWGSPASPRPGRQDLHRHRGRAAGRSGADRILSAGPAAPGALPGRADGAPVYWTHPVAPAVRPGAVPDAGGPADKIRKRWPGRADRRPPAGAPLGHPGVDRGGSRPLLLLRERPGGGIVSHSSPA